MTYLERYLNGECEAVWQELIALGDAVRKEPVYSDAKAVARETMQRTRRNIEKLYERLKNMGYQFEAEKAPQNPFAGLAKQLGQDSLLGSIFGNFFKNMQSSESPPNNQRRAYNPPAAGIVNTLNEYEREIALLPISIRAWCEIVGDVDFRGDYPNLASYRSNAGLINSGSIDIRGMVRGMMAQNPHLINDEDEEVDLSDINTPLPLNQFQKLMREESQAARDLANAPKEEAKSWVTDPLCFDFEIDVDSAQEMMEYNELDESEMKDGALFAMMVAPDYLHKANISGDTYDIFLPNGKADALLHGTGLHFVAYLRKSFEWGGFPMLADYSERDEALIASLKEGLEPI